MLERLLTAVYLTLVHVQETSILEEAEVVWENKASVFPG